MIVSSLAHAAQAVAPAADPRFYDDRGCLAADAASLPDRARLYVQLEGEAGWVDVREGFFAFPRGLQTPMGYGVTVFATEEEAARADDVGRALPWADVVQRVERAQGGHP